jgi:hypothetical protein
MFLFHDNAWLPKIVGTAETIMKVLSVVLTHPPYTLTSHCHIFHLFGPLQEVYEDTLVCMMGHCRMPHSSHCNGRRQNFCEV